MTEITSYRDILAWQKSMDLVVGVYQLAKQFPGDEQFGLTSQMRRAAVSIPANIAEGHGRGHRADYLRFLYIARGSLREVETYLQIAVRLAYIEREDARELWSLTQDVSRLKRPHQVHRR
jgi:four helix bundle protein